MRGPKRAGRKKRLTGWLLCAFWLLGFYSPQAEALRHLPERLVIASGQETAAELPFPLRLTADEREVIMKYNLTERHARALLRLAAPAEEREYVLGQRMREVAPDHFVLEGGTS